MIEVDIRPEQACRPTRTGRRALAARWQAARRLAVVTAYSGGVVAAASALFVGLLHSQAKLARRIIPMAQEPPPRCDGVYGARFPGKPMTVVVLGDSSAAGYGVHRPRETPAALLATGISRRLRRPVRLYRLAVVGAESGGLAAQAEAALEHRPDLAVILVGANDVTHRRPVVVSVRNLVNAVRALRTAGAEVVVGTCPDLGTIQPIRPPLRWLARRWSRQLAAAQTVAVVEAGGSTVSLGNLLGPRFAAEPLRMFSPDRFHPSAEGYAAAAAAILPAALAALGAADERRLTAGEGVRSLPQAAVEAANIAGTEVSGAQVAGREHGPGGRWALLRFRLPAFGPRRAGDGPGALDNPAADRDADVAAQRITTRPQDADVAAQRVTTGPQDTTGQEDITATPQDTTAGRKDITAGPRDTTAGRDGGGHRRQNATGGRRGSGRGRRGSSARGQGDAGPAVSSAVVPPDGGAPSVVEQ